MREMCPCKKIDNSSKIVKRRANRRGQKKHIQGRMCKEGSDAFFTDGLLD